MNIFKSYHCKGNSLSKNAWRFNERYVSSFDYFMRLVRQGQDAFTQFMGILIKTYSGSGMIENNLNVIFIYFQKNGILVV